MLPDRVSNPGPLTYELGALPIALRGPAWMKGNEDLMHKSFCSRTGMHLMCNCYNLSHMSRGVL